MITLACILVAIVVLLAIVIGICGAGIACLLPVIDIIVAILVIYAIIKLIQKLGSKKK